MVGTAPTIEREIEDARRTRDAGVSSKRKDHFIVVERPSAVRQVQ